jgi:hypothetical protein
MGFPQRLDRGCFTLPYLNAAGDWTHAELMP